MADDPKIPDATKIEESTAALKGNTDALGSNTEAGKISAAAMKWLTDETTKVAEAARFATTDLGKLANSTLANSLGFGTLGGAVDTVTKVLEKFGLSVLAVGSSQGRSLINPVSESSEAVRAFNATLGGVNDSLRQLVTTQNAARAAIVLTGGGLAEGDVAASKYPQTLRNMAAMLNITTKELHGMTEVIRQVPGALGEAGGSMMGIGTLAGTTVQPMAVLATTMRAFGMTAQQAADMGKKGFFEFGQTIPDTLKRVGLMADASKQAGVDLLTTKEQIEGASKGLAIFGQGSAVAASTWTTFMTALKGSGVPIGEIGQMVTQLTGSFANMQLQTKAAISAFGGMGGGRTALGGALQMEVNMRTPGGLEKNLEMMTSTLAKFGGGRIITLEQAAANPQLEAQFVVQRQMLMKLGNIQNQEQANRILETMQNVQRGGMSQVEGGKALQDVFEKGKDLQAQQLTVFEKGFQLTQAAIGGAADKVVAGFQKMLTGTAGPTDRERGAARGMSLIGRGLATGDRGQTARGFDTVRDAFSEFIRVTQNVMDISKPKGGQPSTMDIGTMGLDYFFRRQGIRAPGVGMETLPPEARLARRPTHAAIPPEMLAATTTRPSEGPLYRIVGTLQRSDDTKVKLMEQMLASLQQKAAAREMPFVAGEPASRRPALPAAVEGGGEGGSVITVKIVGDEEKVRQIVEEALARKSLYPLGHTE